MKQKRKMTIITMLFALMLACTACGSDSKEEIAGQISEAANDEIVSFAGEISPNEDVVSEESEVAEETVVTEEAELADTPLSIGRIQGGIYTNEYVGMACELDSTWEFYSAEELQDLSGIEELFEGTEVGDAIQGMEQIMDMQAENVEELTSINVLYQKMNMQQRLAYAMLDDDAVVEQTLAQKDLLVESYSQAGIVVEEMSKKTVTFLGEERSALWTKSTMEGIDYYALQIFDFNIGQYSVTITLASFVEDKTEELAQLFYAL